MTVESQCSPGNSNSGANCSWTKLKYEKSNATLQFFGFPKLKKVLFIATETLRTALREFHNGNEPPWNGTRKKYTLIGYDVLVQWGAEILPWKVVVK